MGCGASSSPEASKSKPKEAEGGTAAPESPNTWASPTPTAQPAPAAKPAPKEMQVEDAEEEDGVGELSKPPEGFTKSGNLKDRKSLMPDKKTRMSMAKGKAKRESCIFGPSGPKAQELAQILSDLMFYKENPPLQAKDIEDKKKVGKEIADSGVMPCACAFFFFQVDTDRSEMLDRQELSFALWRIPNFNNALFEIKVSEIFSEGDGWLDLDEWLDLADEMPDLKAAIEAEPINRSWREILG